MGQRAQGCGPPILTSPAQRAEGVRALCPQGKGLSGPWPGHVGAHTPSVCTLQVFTELKSDNQRLKDENGALIRVISKLSK